MRKAGKILLKTVITLMVLIVVAIAAVFIIVGKDNVIAAIKGLTTSTEQLEKNTKDNEKQQFDVLKDHGFSISQEDIEKIASGELTDEQEILDKLLGKDQTQQDETQSGDETDTPQNEGESVKENTEVEQPEKPADKPDDSNVEGDKTAGGVQADNPDKSGVVPDGEKNIQDSAEDDTVSTKQETPEQNDTTKKDEKSKEIDEKIAAVVAKMYVYKSQYSGQISQLVGAMSKEFHSLPAEQQVYSTKLSIYSKYADKITKMEAQADAQVGAIIAELRTLLKENGRDESLADSLLSAYNTEKENTKAYYISRYGD